MKIKWSVYKWAPETFRCSVDGRAFALEDPSHWGMLAVSGRVRELEDEIKRLVRASYKKTRLVTIGFRTKENPRRVCFTHQLLAREDTLSSRLYVYREWKRYCAENGCVLTTPVAVTEGDFVPEKSEKNTVRYVRETVDLHRPITIVVH